MTAYGYCEAYAASESGVELLLVGDSLGMVIQGHDSILPVTIEDVAYHIRCVRRGNQGALLMADLPFMSYYCENATLENSALLMREGAQVVKLEGGAWLASSTKLLVERGVPVCAHMGLTPQSVNHLGGYRVQGRDPVKAQTMIDEAAGVAGCWGELYFARMRARFTRQSNLGKIGSSGDWNRCWSLHRWSDYGAARSSGFVSW